MLKQERQDAILSEVNKERYCTVKALASKLYVAPITIRRDLAEMEAAGLLKRCHGGAAIFETENREIPYGLRERENANAKARIAQKAVKLIQNGSTVFLDASSTVSHIADYLTADMDLTVITNSVLVLERLRGKNIPCYLTGGMLVDTSYALVGTLAEDTYSSLHADICFFSSQGITKDGVITDYSENQTQVRKCMIRNATKSVFLYDRSKVGKTFLFTVCKTQDLYAVVTDD